MRHIRVFVSSPSDVLAERLRIELVCRRLSSRLDGIEFDVYRWEEGNYFSAHETFQRQVPETVDFDLVIGIVWSRIGLPPPDSFPKMPDGRPYPSGTAFEVLTAIEHRRSGAKLPDILFFRKTAALPIEPGASQAELATEGLRALEAFLSEWFFNSSDGFKAAFQVFEGTDAFDRLVEANLYDWLREKGWLGRERRWRIGEQGSPYAGLVAFDASREAVFFGRAHEIVRCRELLDEAAKRGTAFLLIEGASGTGKSSLARAGLLPDLLRPRTGQAERRAAIFTPGDDPCLDLSVALFGALPELDQSDYPWPALLAQHLGASGGIEPVLRSLDRFAAARQTELGAEAPPTTELILLVDQFEQLFTPGTTPESRAGFRAVLDRLARSDRARVIFTLRADAGGAARALPLFPGLLNDGAALTLEAPGPAELKEIIRGPAEAAGLGFARRDGEALDERLLADAMVPDALPLLQFTLQNLYAAAPKSAGEPTEDGTYATLRFEDYDRLGGIAGAIGDVAAKAYASLAPSVQSRLPGLVRSLTAAGPGESLLLSEASYDQATRDGDGRTLADALVEARIVVRDGDALRFAHQRVLEAWLPARAAAVAGRTLIRVRDEVTSDRLRWEAERKSRRRLLTGVRLAEATAALREDADLFTPSAEFIRKSRARARFGQTVTAAAAVVFLGVAVAALSFYLQAARNAEAAQTEAQLKTEALGDVEAQKQIAVHNADEAKAQTARAEDAAKAADASAETARRERDRATAALRTATEAANTLIFDLALKFNDEGLPSSITSVILTQARKLQDSLAASFPDDPDLLRSKAAALISLSELSATQGNGAEALAESNEALAISRALVKMVPGNTTWQRDVTVSLAKIGDLKQQAGDAAGAQAAYEESLGIARALATTDPGNSTWQGDVSLSLDNIGHLKQQAGDAAGAQAAYEESLGIARALARTDPGNTAWQRDLSLSLNNIGDLKQQAGDAAGAQAAYEESLGIVRALARTDPGNTMLQRDVTVSLAKIGDLKLQAGDAAGAQAAYEESLGIARSLATTDPGNSTWQRDVTVSLAKIGDLKQQAGDAAGAQAAYEESLGIVRALARTDPGNSTWQRDVSVTLNNIGDLKLHAGDAAGAQAAYEESLGIARRLATTDPGNSKWQRDVSVSLDNIGDLRQQAGDAAGAQAAYEESLGIRHRLVKAEPGNATWQRDLIVSIVRMALVDPAQAVDRYAEALAIATTLSESGRLAPTDSWMLTEIKKRLDTAKAAK